MSPVHVEPVGQLHRIEGCVHLGIVVEEYVRIAAADMRRTAGAGALCIAAVASGENIRSVFNKLLVWGLSMTVVGAIFCYIFF